MRYLTLIPAVLLLTACASSKTLSEVRADEDAVTVSHDRDPKVMADCVRERLYTARAGHLDEATPSPVETERGMSIVGRSANGYKYVVDIDATAARISMNSGILFPSEARAALTESAEVCATG